MYHGATVPGFPGHPHRGFETVTIVRKGLIDHSDSLGAAARFGGGDVQWLTAGKGIVHAEMFPLLDAGGAEPARAVPDLAQPAGARARWSTPHFTMFWSEDDPAPALQDAGGRTTEVTVHRRRGSAAGVAPLPPPPDSWAARGRRRRGDLDDPHGARRALDAARRGRRRDPAQLYFFRGDSVRIAGRRAEAATPRSSCAPASRSSWSNGRRGEPSSCCCRAGRSASRWCSTGRS